MGYLLTEIVVYLVIASLIGFIFGWLVRDGVLDRFFSKTEENQEVAPTKKAEVAKEESKPEIKEIKKEVAPEKVTEVIKEEIKVEVEESLKEVASEKDISKPTLLTKSPEEGQDILSTIKGIGPVLEKKLNELGIYTFEQIASWDAEQEVWIGTQMAFPKRVTKEEWVKQAKELVNAK